MRWLKRLLWGDDRDHRLIKIEMPDKFPAYVSPRPVTSFYSVYRDALNQQMAMAMQQSMFGQYQGYQGMGLLGQLGRGLGSSVGMAGMLGRRW
jgi:hypothetical protein